MRRARIRTAIRIALATIWLVLTFALTAQSQQRPTPEGVRRDEMADLAVVSLKATPQHPIVGEHVELKLEVRNMARNDARGVGVALFAGKTQVDSKRVDVEAGQVVTVEMSWTAQHTGIHSLAAVIDPAQELTEVDRLDNARFLDIVVSPKHLEGVDFKVSGLEIVSPPNHPTVLRAVVENVGKIAAETPLVFRVEDEVVAVRYLGMLKPGESATIDVPYSKRAPPSRLSVEVNPRHRHAEVNALDNIVTRDDRPPADLVVERLSVGAEQVESNRPSQITVSFSVRNVGASPVATSFRTSIFPGTTLSQGSETSLRTFSVTTPGLGVGQSVHISRTLLWPGGEFVARVEADADKVVAETDETNNIALLNFKNPPDVNRWVSIGPRVIKNTGGLDAIGRLHLIAIDPQSSSTIYVGSRGAGIWKTINAGASWQPITDSLPSLRVTAIAIDPSDTSRLYVATSDMGVFRSGDGGTSWTKIVTDTPVTPNTNEAGEVMIVHPRNPGLIYLTSGSGVYVLQSDTLARRWILKKGGGVATDLVMDPSNPNRLLAAIISSASGALPRVATGIYETRDGGNTWRLLSGCADGRLPSTTGVAKITLAISGSTVYAGYKSKGKFELYRTRTTRVVCGIGVNSEQMWDRRAVFTGQFADDNAWNRINADPSDPRFVYVSGVNFLISTDGGVTFNQQPGAQPHADHHGFAIDPTSSKIIYVISDGGIYRSSNRGLPLNELLPISSWSFLGAGISNVEFYDFTAAATAPNLIIGGTQDNGTLQYTGASTVWDEINDGDGATVDIDPTNPQIMYSMHQFPDTISRKFGFLPLPFEGGWGCIGCGIPNADCRNLHFQVHPTKPSVLLASCISLWRANSPQCIICPNRDRQSQGFPNAWIRIFPTPTTKLFTGNVVRTAIDPTLDLYYVGTDSGVLWAGIAGANWQRLFVSSSGAGIVTDIEVDPDNSSVVYVSTDQANAERILRLTRSSTTPPDITSDLPIGLRVNTLAVDRMWPFTLYAGTNRGVYRGRSADAGATWSWDLYSNGLPLTQVNDLDVHPVTGVLRAATYGRSAYEVNTDFPLGSLLTASGKVTMLRVHEQGTGYGRPTDFLDAEVIIWLDSEPGKAFGFQLRNDPNEGARKGMLDSLRDAFNKGRTVRIDYIRTGVRTGRIIRVE